MHQNVLWYFINLFYSNSVVHACNVVLQTVFLVGGGGTFWNIKIEIEHTFVIILYSEGFGL